MRFGFRTGRNSFVSMGPVGIVLYAVFVFPLIFSVWVSVVFPVKAVAYIVRKVRESRH